MSEARENYEYCARCEKPIPTKYFPGHLHLDEIASARPAQMVRAPFTAVQPKLVPVAEMPSINACTDPLPAITVKHSRSETVLARVVSHQLSWAQRLVGLVQSGKSKLH